MTTTVSPKPKPNANAIAIANDGPEQFTLDFDQLSKNKDEKSQKSKKRRPILNWLTLERIGDIPIKYQSVTGISPQIPDFSTCSIYLADPICARIFKEFLQTEYAAENFTFLHHLDILDRLEDDFEVTRRIMEINKQFIKTRTAKLEVNIPNDVKSEILSKISDYIDKTRLIPATDPRFREFLISRDIFNDARREIEILIKRDSIPRFLKSKFYQELQIELANTYKGNFAKLLSKKTDYSKCLYQDSPPGTDCFIVDTGIRAFQKINSQTNSSSSLTRSSSNTSIGQDSNSSTGSNFSSIEFGQLSSRSRNSSTSSMSFDAPLSARSHTSENSSSTAGSTSLRFRHHRTSSRSSNLDNTINSIFTSPESLELTRSSSYSQKPTDNSTSEDTISPRSSGSASSANSKKSSNSSRSATSIGFISHLTRSSSAPNGLRADQNQNSSKPKKNRKRSLFFRKRNTPKSSIDSPITDTTPRAAPVHAPPKPRARIEDERSASELSAAEFNAILASSYSKSKSLAGGIKLAARVDLDFVPVVYTGPSSSDSTFTSETSKSNTIPDHLSTSDRKPSFDSINFASLHNGSGNSIPSRRESSPPPVLPLIASDDDPVDLSLGE